jgi:glutathione S-transferase
MASSTKDIAKVKLYTTHGCAATHRVRIVLHELHIPYDLENIDITKPRTAEYLAINPRGKVPALVCEGNNIAESAIIVQFLVDAYPSSSLTPAPGGVTAAVQRAKVAWFFDTFMQTVHMGYGPLIMASSPEEAEAAAETINNAVIKDIEPLLADAKPFFGGSATLTLAEALTLPLFIRLFKLSEAGVFPESMAKTFTQRTPNFYAWTQRGFDHPSVSGTYEEEFELKMNRLHVNSKMGKS